jgi:hypothetical protein
MANLAIADNGFANQKTISGAPVVSNQRNTPIPSLADPSIVSLRKLAIAPIPMSARAKAAAEAIE